MCEGMESTEAVGFREQHARARATLSMPNLQPPGTSPAIPTTSGLLSLQFPLEQSPRFNSASRVGRNCRGSGFILQLANGIFYRWTNVFFQHECPDVIFKAIKKCC